MTDHEHLREAADALRLRATEAESEVASLLRDHPEDAGFWTGPTAVTFYEVTDGVLARVAAAASDLRDYAAALNARADDLDGEAGGGPA